MKKKLTAEQLADKIVSEMKAAGLTPYEMLTVIKSAKEKYLRLKGK